MAEIKIPEIKPAGTIEGKVDALYDAYFMLRKWVKYGFSGVLDSENVLEAATVKADWIYAGNIKANQIDVTTGKITTAQIEDLTVGSNVTMGANATISWSQVTNQPSIPTVPSYITSTKITSTTIESPTITGGTITGGTVRTAASGERLAMTSDGIISYDSSNYKEGIAIENGEWGYSELNFYQNGMVVGCLMYDSLGRMSLSGVNDVVMHPYGAWDFSGATVTGLPSVTAKFG